MTNAGLPARLTEFVRFARAQDFNVGVQESVDVSRLAAGGHFVDAQRMYWGLRAVFCHSREDWNRFDDVYRAFWHDIAEPDRETPGAESPSNYSRSRATAGISGTMAADDEGERRRAALREETAALGQGGASSYEVLASRDFRFVWDHEQMRAIEQWVERLSLQLRKRLRRRLRSGASGRRLDFRRTARHSLRYGGWPLDLRYRRRQRRDPNLVLFLDVSQSMEVYSYLFLRFARALAAAMREAEVFAFHTRLVHVGDALRFRDTAEVDRRLAEMSSGWLGGTRISASLADFNRRHHHVVDGRSVVVVFSDGYDTAEPAELVAEVKSIASRARRMVWVNPLLGRGTPAKQTSVPPVERGLAGIQPYLDLYASAHSLDSLRRLGSALIRLC